MRNFKREPTKVICGVLVDNVICKAYIQNFSRMGALITTDYLLNEKKYISIMYQNEKNEMIRMLTYVVHAFKKDKKYLIGLQFVGLEERRNMN
jgi:glycerol-3-phosphate cytidylyltransferase-like family protein